MIKNLYIKNYALIKEVNISFENGYTSVTGETGAGKSIFVGAISLILGERADTSLLTNKEEKCIVEGEFDLSRFKLDDFFDKNDLDFNKTAIIRREINTNGRSRSFINDTPVSLTQLKQLGIQLFDIHSQNQNQKINEKSFQLKILDTFSNNKKLLAEYKLAFSDYINQKKTLDNLIDKAKNNRSDLDYKHFLLNELNEANLNKDEKIDSIEDELKMLANAEDISIKLAQAIEMSEDSEYSIVNLFSQLNSLLQTVAKFSPKIESVSERTESILLEFKDCLDDLNKIGNDIVHDPQRLKLVRERYDTIQSLFRKHSLSSVQSLVELQNKLSVELNEVNDIEQHIVECKNKLDSKYKKALKLAQLLSDNRLKSCSKFEKEIQSTLSLLGMSEAKLKVKLSCSDTINKYGMDDIMFLFSANKGIEISELTKVASGGELSRLMFSIKSSIASKMNLPTILFDEIDTGVSGEIAHKMGRLMKKMTLESSMQVISITHLPQVAAMGTSQMFVEKKIEDNSTFTHIRTLTSEEREVEIAKMLSGEQMTKVSLSNARELLAS